MSKHSRKDSMVYLTRKIEFSAEENRRVFGKCNNPNGHGHNYVLEVTVGGEPDPATGMVLDLKQLKEILEREVMERMDHRFLNYEVAELAGQIPTCENIAAVIWRLLDPKINVHAGGGRLARVRLWETPDLYVDCYGPREAGNGDRADGASATDRNGLVR